MVLKCNPCTPKTELGQGLEGGHLLRFTSRISSKKVPWLRRIVVESRKVYPEAVRWTLRPLRPRPGSHMGRALEGDGMFQEGSGEGGCGCQIERSER